MPSGPNTPAILQQIKTMAQGVQVGSSNFFQSANCKVGRFKDIRDNLPAFEVVLGPKDETKRQTSGGAPVVGGRIDDSQDYTFEVTLAYSDADSEIVESTTLPGIRDALTQMFHASANLGMPGQVQSSQLTGIGEYLYLMRSGEIYRMYRNVLRVQYQYNVLMVP